MSTIAESTPLSEWIDHLLGCREMRLMGHAQRQDDGNLGLGWLYYALGRMLRPSKAVVIGSYRGFVPLVIARALADNSEGGQVHFIDPSLVDGFWSDESAVRDHFCTFGGANIVHYQVTTQQFVASKAYRDLQDIGLVFIDGFHSAEQAQFDFDAFADKVAPQGMILLHDSVWRIRSGIYGPGREYIHNVTDFIDALKRNPEWQVLDLPFGSGVTVVRRCVVPKPPR
ncbi:MAG TPA: class I SAM-dependent methyltransferase [Pirellulales bacterium]|nr:class I SAM-dependent methyltransferase [Pirellulales bacterium]